MFLGRIFWILSTIAATTLATGWNRPNLDKLEKLDNVVKDKDKVLFLNLDETLFHTSEYYLHYKDRLKKAGRFEPEKWAAEYLEFTEHGPKGTVRHCARARNHLQYFLEEVSRGFRLVAYSCRPESYVTAAVSALEAFGGPDVKFEAVRSDKYCDIERVGSWTKGWYQPKTRKNLTYLIGPMLEHRTVVLDSELSSYDRKVKWPRTGFSQRKNLMVVTRWGGGGYGLGGYVATEHTDNDLDDALFFLMKSPTPLRTATSVFDLLVNDKNRYVQNPKPSQMSEFMSLIGSMVGKFKNAFTKNGK